MSEAASTTAASPLLKLPVPHLEHIIEYLSAAEFITVESLTCKGIAPLIRPACWSSAIRIGLEAMLPAELYFKNGANGSAYELMGVEGRKRFPKQAKKVDRALKIVLDRAGLGTNAVSWAATIKDVRQRPDLEKDDNHIQVITGRQVRWEGGEAAGVQSRAAFVQWAREFRCRGCKGYGKARRQCAICGKLLCLDCSIRCSEDRPRVEEGVIDAHCPFALCERCDGDQSMPDRFKVVPMSWVLEMWIPALCPTSCMACMFHPQHPRFCPWHANGSLFDCERCKKEYCTGHREEWMVFCPACCICFCVECRPDDLCHRHCESCGYECCSACRHSDTCPECGEEDIVDGRESDTEDEEDEENEEDEGLKKEEEENGDIETSA